MSTNGETTEGIGAAPAEASKRSAKTRLRITFLPSVGMPDPEIALPYLLEAIARKIEKGDTDAG